MLWLRLGVILSLVIWNFRETTVAEDTRGVLIANSRLKRFCGESCESQLDEDCGKRYKMSAVGHLLGGSEEELHCECHDVCTQGSVENTTIVRNAQ